MAKTFSINILDSVSGKISIVSSAIDPIYDPKYIRVFVEKPDAVGVLPADLKYNYILK